MNYVITQGQYPFRVYYRWSDEINDILWVTHAFIATVWHNRRDAERVARANGGNVIRISKRRLEGH